MMTVPAQDEACEPYISVWADHEIELKRNAEAPAIARAVARGRCHDLQLSGSLCQTLVLLVSEVISNAVLHSGGPLDSPITLTINITEQTMRIAVIDAGQGFTPVPRDPARTEEGGYGLYLLEKAADSWGVDSVGGTRVWFELNREA